MAVAVSEPDAPDEQMRSIDSSVSAASARSRSRRSSCASSMTRADVSGASVAEVGASVCTGDSLRAASRRAQIDRVGVGRMPAVITAVLAVDESRLSSMFVFFFIALLIVSPFGYRRVKAVLAERRELLGRGGSAPAEPTGTPASTPDPDDLAGVVAAIATAAGELAGDRSGSRIVEVPAVPTVEGRPADRVVIDALVDDAVRRAGLTSTWEGAADGPRRLTLRRP